MHGPTVYLLLFTKWINSWIIHKSSMKKWGWEGWANTLISHPSAGAYEEWTLQIILFCEGMCPSLWDGWMHKFDVLFTPFFSVSGCVSLRLSWMLNVFRSYRNARAFYMFLNLSVSWCITALGLWVEMKLPQGVMLCLCTLIKLIIPASMQKKTISSCLDKLEPYRPSQLSHESEWCSHYCCHQRLSS